MSRRGTGGPAEPPGSRAERVRLFAALELPPAAREELLRWRRAAVGDGGGLRMIAPEYLHATLCFLGWRLADDASEILAACSVVAGGGAIELEMGQPLWLPRRQPRVLAVELDDKHGKLGEMQGSLSRALAEGGWYVPEKRPYLAHVTVARVPSSARQQRGGALPGARPGALPGARPGALPPPPSHHFEASRVTLYRSRLGAGGARYEALGIVELTSASD